MTGSSTRVLEITGEAESPIRLLFSPTEITEARSRNTALYDTNGERLDSSGTASERDQKAVVESAVHQAMDNLGLAMPQFDSIGAYVEALFFVAEFLRQADNEGGAEALVA